MTAAPNLTPLLTEEQAAEILGVSDRTLRELRRQGEIRYVAVSKRTIRYRIEDCRDYIDAHVRAESPPCETRPGPKRVNRGAAGGNVVRFTQRAR